MLQFYLLFIVHKLILFALITNAIIVIHISLYMYLLKSLYLLEFIVVYVCIEVECIYSNCFTTVFIGLVFIADFIYLFLFVDLDLFFFIQYMYYKIY